MVNRTSNKPRVIIVGAGPAGLTAALSLLQQGLAQPIILETERIPGGLSRTESYHGNKIDLGGHRFFSRNEQVKKLWQSILPLQGQPAWDDLQLQRIPELDPTGPDPARTERVMLSRQRVSRIYFRNRFFDYPLSLNLKTLRSLGLGLSLQIGWDYLAALLRPRPVKSLEDFYINRFGQKLYQLFFEDYTAKLWGRHPRDIAPDWGAQRVRGLSLSRVLWSAISKPFRRQQPIETSLIDSFHYPKLGPGQYWQAMADEVIRLGGVIHYGQRVEKILASQQDSQPSFAIQTVDSQQNSQTYIGTALFSSMAIRDLLACIEPAPPPRIGQLAAELPYRDFITCGVLARRLNVTNTSTRPTLNDLIPDNWIYIQDRAVKLGRLQIFNNWSPYLVADPLNTVWIGLEYFASEGDELWSLPDADFKALAIRELALIGLIEPAQVLDQVVYRIRKAYPAYFDSYRDFAEIRAYLQQVPGLYCIGRNGQHRYNNMDHSMLTGLEAVRCFQGLSSQADLWAVNTEETYGG